MNLPPRRSISILAWAGWIVREEEVFEEYGGKYTIKKYHGEKTVNEDGVEVHSKIELQPLNTKDFASIEIPENAETQYATIGILKFIIGQ